MTPPRNSRNSPSEQTDEAPGLIERDQVEIERDIPADGNEGVERIPPADTSYLPAYQD
jgi:hypothetical protein